MGLLVQSGIHIENYEPHCDVACSGGLCTIDLRRAAWMDAFAVAAIATHIQQNHRADKKTVLVAPEDDRVSSYVSAMGLAEVAQEHDAEIRGHLKKPRRKRKGDRLVELQVVSDDAGADGWGDFVRERLLPRANEGPTAEALGLAADEAAGNAKRHADAGIPPVLAAQRHARTGEVVVAVGDTGVGIPGTLRARHEVRDDGDALRKAVRAGVSATDDSAGDGLAELTERVTTLGGTVVLRSGSAMLQIRGRRVRPPKKAMWQRGTVVGARIPWRAEG